MSYGDMVTQSQPSPLISPFELSLRMPDPSVRLADVRWFLGDAARGRHEYEAAHLPGAIFVDLDTDLSATSGPGRHPLPEPIDLRRRLESLGFGDEHSIVVYDDANGTVAARMWWMLDRLGHADVTVLDGGLQAWRHAGGVPTGEVIEFPAMTLSLGRAWTGVIDRDELARMAAVLDLIDLRAAERYRGDVEPVDTVAGHIPGARNCPAATLLDEDGGLLEPGRLQVQLRAHGIDTNATSVMSCGSGVTACFGALAARIAGIDDPLVYPGSYSDWSSAGMPIATGDAPGSLTRTG